MVPGTGFEPARSIDSRSNRGLRHRAPRIVGFPVLLLLLALVLTLGGLLTRSAGRGTIGRGTHPLVRSNRGARHPPVARLAAEERFRPRVASRVIVISLSPPSRLESEAAQGTIGRGVVATKRSNRDPHHRADVWCKDAGPREHAEPVPSALPLSYLGHEDREWESNPRPLALQAK